MKESGVLTDGVQVLSQSPAKIGRNDPCPCGSGKKYKKCCIGKLHAAPATGSAQAIEDREYDLYPSSGWDWEGDEAEEDEAEEEDAEEEDDEDEWQVGEEEDDEGEDNAYPQFPAPPTDDLPALSPEQDRLVDGWWKASNPIFKKRDADAMLLHLTRFWDQHPELVPHLDPEMEYVFELGTELGRRREWPRYAELLLRLRGECPAVYLNTYGYLDYQLIIEALVNGRTEDLPRYFDFFQRYPGSDMDNADRVANLLAWAGAQDALLEFVKPLRATPGACGLTLDSQYLMQGLCIPYLDAGAEPDVAADSVAEEARRLRVRNLYRPSRAFLRMEFEQARQPPGLPDYGACVNRDDVKDFHRAVTWNFIGFLHASKGLPWTKAYFLAGRLQYYWLRRSENARPRKPFSLELCTFEAFVYNSSRSIVCNDGVLAASAIEAMGHFADYLCACDALGDPERRSLQEGCRTLYQQALASYESTDPVPRLMPELPRTD